MALFTTKGTISYMSEVKSGQSNNGNRWQRMTIHLDVPGFQGAFQKIVFTVSGNRVDDVLEFSVGDRVSVNFSIYAREYNDRWYNNLDIIHIETDGASDHAAPGGGDGEFQAEDMPF